MAAPVDDNAEVYCPCGDFMQFEDALKKLRINDDKIVYKLNTILPTKSFQQNVDSTKQCKSLYEQMTNLYEGRERAISKCVNEAKQDVDQWRQKRMDDRDDQEAINMLRKSQHKLKLMQRELEIDRIKKEKSSKVFYERCRNFYMPPNPPMV